MAMNISGFGTVRFGASKGIYAQEHRGPAGPYQRRGILQGVFGEAGAVIIDLQRRVK